MKTVVLNEQQLKDAAKGLEIVTCEPVKKGERLIEHWEAPLDKLKGKISIPAMIHDGKKTICYVGELVQAVNEKGEKQYWCSTCKIIEINQKYKNVYQYCPNFDCEGLKSHVGQTRMKPLLVWLTKIEEKKMLVLAKDLLVELKQQKQYGNLKTINCWLNTWKETQ